MKPGDQVYIVEKFFLTIFKIILFCKRPRLLIKLALELLVGHKVLKLLLQSVENLSALRLRGVFDIDHSLTAVDVLQKIVPDHWGIGQSKVLSNVPRIILFRDYHVVVVLHLRYHLLFHSLQLHVFLGSFLVHQCPQRKYALSPKMVTLNPLSVANSVVNNFNNSNRASVVNSLSPHFQMEQNLIVNSSKELPESP